jgi:hypothetical protein
VALTARERRDGADEARNGEERGSDRRDPNRSPAATIVQLDCWP